MAEAEVHTAAEIRKDTLDLDPMEVVVAAVEEDMAVVAEDPINKD